MHGCHGNYALVYYVTQDMQRVKNNSAKVYSTTNI